MLVVETISKIRRLAHVQGKAIKAICRELGISRKVVRKVLRTDETEFTYERSRQPHAPPRDCSVDRDARQQEARYDVRRPSFVYCRRDGPMQDRSGGTTPGGRTKVMRAIFALIAIFKDSNQIAINHACNID